MALRSRLVPTLVGITVSALLAAAACHNKPAAQATQSAPDAAVAVAPFVPQPGETSTGKLVAFETEQDFDAFMQAWRDQEQRKQEARRRPFPMKSPPGDAGPPADGVASEAQAAPAPAAPPKAARAESRNAASKDKKESITNNQNANVDEGDIVKLHGDHLVVLRRGRLFTLGLNQSGAAPIATVDAFGPGIDPSGTWYDEMLIEGDNVVVVGFSYQRGGTEIGLFKIDAKGKLTYRSTYHLRSNDYYSARNYASRIVDGHLVFYTPTYLSTAEDPQRERWPAVRRWRSGAQPTDFQRTLRSNKLYHLEDELPPSSQTALHTVTSCDLRAAQFSCDSIGIMGPPSRVFYVSDSSVYVWMREWSNFDGDGHPPGLLAKIPLSPAQKLTAIRVHGMPTDQFSFDEADGHLNVLVRAESNGDAMFASETTGGKAALMRVPLGMFSESVPATGTARYRRMPAPDGGSVQNRFVGSWLLYGAGNGYWHDKPGMGRLYAARVTDTGDPMRVDLEQGVDRIEPMGDNAVVVGSRGSDLVFSPIELAKDGPHAKRDYVRRNASQGELRSHGFFYKDTSAKPGQSQGMIGLPIRSEGARGTRYLTEGSAAVLFLGENALELQELGSLEASGIRTINDGCRASCVDWYGNARPIFVGGRVFALMGYELVEGQLAKSKLLERRRLDFAPHGGPPARGEEDW